MSKFLRLLAASAAFAACALGASGALAWGDTGHRMIARLAVEALPQDLPEFVRSARAAEDVGELAREPDRWRGAGKVHDSTRDPGHFVDVDDDGRVLGGPALDALPPTRAEYESALRNVDQDTAKAGFLPYAIVDGFQQLAKDFAYWRAAQIGGRLQKDDRKRAWIIADRIRRERLILTDLGIWAHYVGDGAQPLHVSVHFNGWGDFPNPERYTGERIHVPFEGPFVSANVHDDDVRSMMAPYAPCKCTVEARTARYLKATYATVIPFYELEKDGGLKPGDPRGPEFAAGRIAAGASELRDLVVDAWRASNAQTVGYPAASLKDLESGKADAYAALHGLD